MRLELQFDIAKNEIPKDHKSIWVSFLKKVISECNNGEYYDRYFSQVKEKDYCFTMHFPELKYINDKGVFKGNQIKMIFSCDEKKNTGFIFLMGFIQAKNKSFPLPYGNSMVLKSVRKLGDQRITGSKALFRTATGGGLVVKEHDRKTNKDTYYTYLDKDFSEKLNTVLRQQALDAGFPSVTVESLKCIPIMCKKEVVKQYDIYIDATTGVFQVEGRPELLQYFYQAGMGSKHSMGYGLMNLIVQE